MYINIKLAIELKDENVQIGSYSVSFIDLAMAASTITHIPKNKDGETDHPEEEYYKKVDDDSLRSVHEIVQQLK